MIQHGKIYQNCYDLVSTLLSKKKDEPCIAIIIVPYMKFSKVIKRNLNDIFSHRKVDQYFDNIEFRETVISIDNGRIKIIFTLAEFFQEKTRGIDTNNLIVMWL